jgi:hypothetical protein
MTADDTPGRFRRTRISALAVGNLRFVLDGFAIQTAVGPGKRANRRSSFAGHDKSDEPQLVSDCELQIGPRDFCDNVTSVFLQSYSSVAVSTRSAHGSKFNVDFEIWAVAANEGAVHSTFGYENQPTFGSENLHEFFPCHPRRYGFYFDQCIPDPLIAVLRA